MINEKPKILIVDDEDDNLALMYRILRQKYDITKAHNGKEALEILDEKTFKCIISDHKMPVMDGVEFLKLSLDKCPQTTRILVTAYSDVSILINAINAGKIYKYLKKPYSPDELISVVKSGVEYCELKSENETLISDLKDLFSGTITSIMEALDSKDSFTLGRSMRVAFLVTKIASKLTLSKRELNEIKLAALLHDIGMIGVSEIILNKTSKLTDDEYKQIKKHIYFGVKILEDIKQLQGVTNIIKYHHEFYNGCGYPEGLKGEQIPIGSRIIAICDAFDSLVSKRAYRDSLSEFDALNIIKKGSGTQFDPSLVQIFENLLPHVLEEARNQVYANI